MNTITIKTKTVGDITISVKKGYSEGAIIIAVETRDKHLNACLLDTSCISIGRALDEITLTVYRDYVNAEVRGDKQGATLYKAENKLILSILKSGEVKALTATDIILSTI